MTEITTEPSNFDLYAITQKQSKEIEQLKEELDELKRSLSYQLNILL